MPLLAIKLDEAADVPGWDREDCLASQAYGDRWLKDKRTAVLVVPSIVAYGLEQNVIMNSTHGDFNRITSTKPMNMDW